MKDYIAHLQFDTLSEPEVLDFVKDKINAKEKCLVVTPNLDNLRITYKNKQIRSFINHADLSTIDGTPVKWIARWLHKKNFKYKISGSDLSINVIKLANDNNFSLLLFGGKEGVAELAKEKILEKYPNMKITAICPEFGYEKDELKSLHYMNLINEANADINLLCTGFPKTEMFFDRNKDKFHNAAYLFVGATVDFIAGSVKRAPKWMSKVGLEWLYRLFHDFGRLFKRYWLDFWFLVKVFFICLFHKKKFQKLISEVA